MSTVRIVDDSQLAREGMTFRRKPKIIGVYGNRKNPIAREGTKVILAIRGQKQRAIVVGCKGFNRLPGKAYFDTNNCVLIDEQDTPLGKRVMVPIPSALRAKDHCAKLVAIATKFV